MGWAVVESPAASEMGPRRAVAPDEHGDGPCSTPAGLAAMTVGMKRVKSGKRLAIEARLAKRAKGFNGARALPVESSPSASSSEHIPACSDCSTSSSYDSWCGVDVQVPCLDWSGILSHSGAGLAAGKEPGVFHLMPGKELTVLVVEEEAALPRALSRLRESMEDDVVGIDLEWRPSFRPGVSHRVALMQLASSSVCVLVRLCNMGRTFPPVLAKFFRTTTIVGYSWDSSDEARMQDSFGCGKDLFPSFFDVQRISEELGYHGLGLAALAGRLLGCSFRKARSVTMSNWEVRTLAPAQLRYAALDAFVTGQLFRLVRRWRHDLGSTCCTMCLIPFGQTIDIQDWRCGNCNKCLGSYQALQSHCHSTGHPPMVSQCFDCGRYRRVTL